MTKNRAFKQAVRAHMKAHEISYATARQMMTDSDAVRKPTAAHNCQDMAAAASRRGTITSILGRTASGKTSAVRTILSGLDTNKVAVFSKYEGRRAEYSAYNVDTFIESFEDNTSLMEVASSGKYSTFIFDEISTGSLPEGLNPFDSLPSDANIFLLLHSLVDEEGIQDVVSHLDSLNLSGKTLEGRVGRIKHTYRGVDRTCWAADYVFCERCANFFQQSDIAVRFW